MDWSMKAPQCHIPPSLWWKQCHDVMVLHQFRLERLNDVIQLPPMCQIQCLRSWTRRRRKRYSHSMAMSCHLAFRCLLLAGWYIHSIQTTGWSCWGLVLSWHRTRLSCAKRSCSTQNIKTSMHMYINPQTAVAVVVWDITWKGSGIHASPDFEDTLVVYDEYVSRARVIPSYSYPVLSRWSPLVYTCIHSQGRTHT